MPRATSRPRVKPSRSTRSSPSPAPAILARLEAAYPGATTELRFGNAFELLVATMLSAQSTDVRVNQVTPELFAKYPDAASLAGAALSQVEQIVKSTGFFRTKARALVTMAQHLVAQHDGRVPASMEALVELPGVGRKTANVVLGHALGVPGLPVDRHVMRVATRLGLASAATPELVEQQLCSQLPPDRWTLASDCLILHGRRVCRPAPACQRCMVAEHCSYFRRAAPSAAEASRPRRRAQAVPPVRSHKRRP